MSGYIDDAGNGGGEQSDSYLGSAKEIFHGENDKFTQELDARMIAKLTPEQRLKMGAEAGAEPRPSIKLGELEEQRRRFVDEEKQKRQSQQPAPRRMQPIVVIVIILALLALAFFAGRAHGVENSVGNSQEIPVKSVVPASSPTPTTP
jgi:hypothetical protein